LSRRLGGARWLLDGMPLTALSSALCGLLIEQVNPTLAFELASLNISLLACDCVINLYA
jgi:hypothetical protein